MRILLDECVTKHLKPHLSDYEVSTVREMHWSGIKNGKLIALCREHGFDVLLTIDKNFKYQQNIDKYPVTIVILNSFTSKAEELITYLPAFKRQLQNFLKHRTYVIDK